MIEIVDRFVMVAQHDVDLGQVLEPKPQHPVLRPAQQLDEAFFRVGTRSF